MAGIGKRVAEYVPVEYRGELDKLWRERSPNVPNDEQSEQEQGECANCHALTSEWDEELRRYLHDGCRGEYLFGE